MHFVIVMKVDISEGSEYVPETVAICESLYDAEETMRREAAAAMLKIGNGATLNDTGAPFSIRVANAAGDRGCQFSAQEIVMKTEFDCST